MTVWQRRAPTAAATYEDVDVHGPLIPVVGSLCEEKFNRPGKASTWPGARTALPSPRWASHLDGASLSSSLPLAAAIPAV